VDIGLMERGPDWSAELQKPDNSTRRHKKAEELATKRHKKHKNSKTEKESRA